MRRLGAAKHLFQAHLLTEASIPQAWALPEHGCGAALALETLPLQLLGQWLRVDRARARFLETAGNWQVLQSCQSYRNQRSNWPVNIQEL